MKPKFHARIRIRFLILYMILGQYGLKRWYGMGNCQKIIGSVPDVAVVRSIVQDIQRIFSWFCMKLESVLCAVLLHNEPLPLFEKMVRMPSLFTPQQKNQGLPKLVYLEILSPSDNRCGKITHSDRISYTNSGGSWLGQIAFTKIGKPDWLKNKVW